MQKANFTDNSFHYKGLDIGLHPEVYDPAEDTFLLLDSLVIHPGSSILEIGTGCGLIALACAHKGFSVVCTDINPFAVELTRQNITRNQHLIKGSVEARQGDLFNVLASHERFHLIVFNPPYLPTSQEEKKEGWFEVATDGGKDGLAVTRKFLHGVKPHLLKTGEAYFIFSSLADRLLLEEYMRNEGFSFTIAARRMFEGEELDVYRIVPVD